MLRSSARRPTSHRPSLIYARQVPHCCLFFKRKTRILTAGTTLGRRLTIHGQVLGVPILIWLLDLFLVLQASRPRPASCVGRRDDDVSSLIINPTRVVAAVPNGRLVVQGIRRHAFNGRLWGASHRWALLHHGWVPRGQRRDARRRLWRQRRRGHQSRRRPADRLRGGGHFL